MDRYKLHKALKVIRWIVRHHLHFMPTSASRLDQVERFFLTITTRRIRRGTIRERSSLEPANHDYLAHCNEHYTPFVWAAMGDVILAKVSRSCERSCGTRH